MSRKANGYDNAAMESFWATLKLELVYRTRFLTHADAHQQIFDSIARFYDTQSLHSDLGYLSPRPVRATILTEESPLLTAQFFEASPTGWSRTPSQNQHLAVTASSWP